MSGPGSKRAAGDGGSGPPEKKANREEKTTTTLIEPIRLGGISSTVRTLKRAVNRQVVMKSVTVDFKKNCLEMLEISGDICQTF